MALSTCFGDSRRKLAVNCEGMDRGGGDVT